MKSGGAVEVAADAFLRLIGPGAHVVGSAQAYRHFVGQIAARTGVACSLNPVLQKEILQ